MRGNAAPCSRLNFNPATQVKQDAAGLFKSAAQGARTEHEWAKPICSVGYRVSLLFIRA